MNDSQFDDAIDALGNAHRRQLLVELREDNPHGELPTADRRGVPADELAIEMIHSHLPKLEDYGYVEWDERTGTVYRGPQFAELSPLLDVVAKNTSKCPSDCS